jgi:hypothetical protein
MYDLHDLYCVDFTGRFTEPEKLAALAAAIIYRQQDKSGPYLFRNGGVEAVLEHVGDDSIGTIRGHHFKADFGRNKYMDFIVQYHLENLPVPHECTTFTRRAGTKRYAKATGSRRQNAPSTRTMN